MATPHDFGAIAASHEAITGKGPLLFRLGLGDYDGNTIIQFLQDRAFCQVEFIDRRCANESIRCHLESPMIKGFLLNVQRRKPWIPSFIYSSRHWYVVVKTDWGDWYMVDSAKENVEQLADVPAYLETIQNNQDLDANLMVVKETQSTESAPAES